MVQKFIFLFSISIACIWQTNLFSMNSSELIMINEPITKCQKCNSEIEIFTNFSVINHIYCCTNYKCGQNYCLIIESNNDQKKETNMKSSAEHNGKQSIENENNKQREISTRSKQLDIDISLPVQTLLQNLKLAQQNLQSSLKNESCFSTRKKYAFTIISVLVIYLAWRYHTQIEKFLFTK